jgi:hypothetical protein
MRPIIKPARRPIRFIKTEAGKVTARVPQYMHAIGNVAQTFSAESASPTKAEAATISELPDSISA